MTEKKKKTRTESEMIEHSLITTYKFRIWRMFTKAIKMYDLIQENDHIMVCISGGKDSMILGLLFKHLARYSDFPFRVTYVVMNPGYNDTNFELIKNNLRKLKIPAHIVKTDIFAIANNTERKPCYLCAKMRRGALYRIAREMGCNKIALGHHYDDVIETTLMNMLNAGSFQTMLPKLHSDHYKGLELIRPLYFVRERDIIDWSKFNHLEFIRCACRFTETISSQEETENDSQRLKTKLLIARLMKEYSDMVEKNIFKAAENCNTDMLLGYKKEGIEHSFLDNYEENGKKIDALIEKEGIEAAALKKAVDEHEQLFIDNSIYDEVSQEENNSCIKTAAEL